MSDEDLQRQRDEARETVKRLRKALKLIACYKGKDAVADYSAVVAQKTLDA